MDLTWEDRQRAFQAKVLTEGVSEEFAIGVRPYRTFVGAATGTPPPAGSRLERALIVVIAGAAIAATLVLLGGPRTIVAVIAGLTGGVAMFTGLAGPDPRIRHDLDEPLLAQRLQQLGLRYVIWVQGQTKRVSQSGSMTCGVGAGGGGCFGFLTWENDASYEASIWDTQQQRAAGRVSSDAAGTSYMPALVVPIPIIARVQNNACTGLANQLEGFILNK